MSNTTTTANGTARRGKLGQRVAYACGNLGQSAFYNALSTYFVVYVTSSLFAGVDKGVATKLIGVITGLVVVIRIAEIFIDPLLGNIIDNTTTKWGRFRPWQFLAGAISSVLIVLVYTGLFGLVNVNTTWFIVLFVITFIVLDVFYSLRDISYWGMIPALSSDSHERSTYTALGSFTGSIGYNGITVVVIPIVTYFSWVFTGEHAEASPAGPASVLSPACSALDRMDRCLRHQGERERPAFQGPEERQPDRSFKAIFQNDQLLWVALSYLLYAIANVATTGVLIFLFKFILDNQAAYSLTGVIALVAGLVMAPLYPILNKRIPRRYLYIGGMISMIAGYVMLGIFSDNIIMVFVALVLFYVPGTLIQMTAILSLTDSIEYGQLKNGKRNEAVTLSVRPMLDKIGGAMSNGIVGIIAVAAGMTGNATAADMTASNIHIFKICAFYIPLVLIILSLIVFLFKVKITEKMHDEIVKELEVKLANGEIEADDAQTVEAVEAVAVAETAGTAGTATPAGQPESR